MVAKTLPKTWQMLTLAEVVEPDSKAIVSGPFGSNIGRRFFVEHGVPVIRGNNLTKDMNRFINDGFVFITEEKAQELRNCEALADDLVFTAAGTLGQVGIIPKDTKYPKYIISNKQMRVRVSRSKVDPLYAFYWLSSPEMVRYINQRNTGSSVPLINLGVLRSLPIPVPPLCEQQRIVNILGMLDDKIVINQRTTATLEHMARAIFKSWFVDFDPVRAKSVGKPTGLPKEISALFPARLVDSDLGEIPEGWRVSTLGEIAVVIDCLHAKKPERTKQGKPFLQLGNICGNGLLDMSDTFYVDEADYNKWISRMEASAGDCVITNVGLVGAVARIPTGLKAALGRNMTGIRCKPGYPVPAFMIECLLSGAMREEIVGKTDTGTILDALNVKNIPKLRFVLPCTNLLRRFEEQIQPLRLKMEQNLSESICLREIRDAMLPKLMSGELRV